LDTVAYNVSVPPVVAVAAENVTADTLGGGAAVTLDLFPAASYW
jgi:hypothetical protein